MNLPIRVLVRLAAGLAFGQGLRICQTAEGSAKPDPPNHSTPAEETHGSPARESQGEVDLTAEVRLRAWWAGGSSLVFGVGFYFLGIIFVVGPKGPAALIVGAREQLGNQIWGYGPGSVALGVAAAALTMFIATTLSESWRSRSRSADRRELSRRVATADLTEAVFLFGASLIWAILMDALVAGVHHPVEVLTSILVMLLCVGLFAVAAAPDDVQDHREQKRSRERDALDRVIRDLTEASTSKRPASWWPHVAAAVWFGLVAAVLTVVLVWGAAELEISGGNEYARAAVTFLILLAPLSFAQVLTAARNLVERDLRSRLHRRGGAPWWIVICIVGVLVFVALAVVFALAGMWLVAAGLVLAEMASLGVLLCYGRTSVFKRDVARLARVRLRSTDQELDNSYT